MNSSIMFPSNAFLQTASQNTTFAMDIDSQDDSDIIMDIDSRLPLSDEMEDIKVTYPDPTTVDNDIVMTDG